MAVPPRPRLPPGPGADGARARTPLRRRFPGAPGRPPGTGRRRHPDHGPGRQDQDVTAHGTDVQRRGWTDVFRVPGNQMLRVMGKFDGAYGRFMYHCHLLEHEDMGMMRPFVVMPARVLEFDHGGAHGGTGRATPADP
ncbi:multicopper oxidase domain-containing protein [Streptomyces massasporeus]|uniref:multicopper oxidase domain-containing protein n=1 Tax=Streptomyces massasporeus TaxID=67324 RepID=UPI00371A4DCA